MDASESPAEDAASWPVHVRLSNGAVHGVDFVVSATGVAPSTAWLPAELARDPRCLLCWISLGVLVHPYPYHTCIRHWQRAQWICLLSRNIPDGSHVASLPRMILVLFRERHLHVCRPSDFVGHSQV